MSARTIKADSGSRWGSGATVAIYPENQCKVREGLAPVGSPITSVAAGSDTGAAVTGLPDGTPLGAYSFVGGKHNYVLFVA